MSSWIHSLNSSWVSYCWQVPKPPHLMSHHASAMTRNSDKSIISANKSILKIVTVISTTLTWQNSFLNPQRNRWNELKDFSESENVIRENIKANNTNIRQLIRHKAHIAWIVSLTGFTMWTISEWLNMTYRLFNKVYYCS